MIVKKNKVACSGGARNAKGESGGAASRRLRALSSHHTSALPPHRAHCVLPHRRQAADIESHQPQWHTRIAELAVRGGATAVGAAAGLIPDRTANTTHRDPARALRRSVYTCGQSMAWADGVRVSVRHRGPFELRHPAYLVDRGSASRLTGLTRSTCSEQAETDQQ